MPQNENVAKNNDRLFSIYEAHLKMPSDKDYVDITTKLTAWLSDPKAYYALARPKIVQLLIAAQMTLRGAVGHSLDIRSPLLPNHYLHHPLAASYVGLIKALAPFRDLFVEPSLQDDVTHLLKSIEGINLANAPAPSVSSTRSQQSPFPSASSPTSHDPNPQHTWPTMSSNATSPPGSLSVTQTKDNIKPEDQMANGQIGPTVAGIQKAVTSGELNASVFASPLGVQTSGTDSQRSPSPEIVFLGMFRNPAAARDAPISTLPTKSPSIPTPGSVGAPKNPGKPKSRRKKKVDITAFVQADLQDFKQKQAQARRQTSGSVPLIKREPETEQMPLAVDTKHGGDGVDATPTAQNLTGQATQFSWGGPQSPSSTSHVVTNSIETASTPPVPAIPLVPKATNPPSTVLPGIQNIKQPATQTEGSRLPQETRPLLISEDSGLAQLFKWYEEYRSAENKSPHNTEEPGEQGEREVFDNAGLAEDMETLNCAEQDPDGWFHIIALTPGHAGDTNMEFTVDITESTMGAISKWVKRSTLRLRDIKPSYCLSLGCYSSQDLLKYLRQKAETTTDAALMKAVTSLPSFWPQNGGLTLNVRFGDSRKDLPIAPPFLITGDGFVDVSEFVAVGTNSIVIHQRGMDFTDLTFVLHIHNPTLKQLQEIVELRRQETEWKDWLVDVTRPLETMVPRRVIVSSTVA